MPRFFGLALPGFIRSCAVLLLAAPSGGGGQATSGALQGFVVAGAAGSALEAEIMAERPDLPGRLVRADARGFYSLADLPVGRYSVLIRHIGYRAVRYDSVTVSLGRTTTLPLTSLSVSEITLSPLVVPGSRVPIDLASASNTATLESSLLRALPQERDVGSILAMFPQHNASPYGDGINVAGSTGYENAFFVDGAHITDPYLGRAGSALPYNFVREIQVTSGGYEAEFGRASGGIVNVLTHSGGNEFRFDTFGYFTNNRFSGERRVGLLDRSVKSYSFYDVGGSVGGPVARDRAWFFAAYNPTHSMERIRVPSFSPQEDVKRQHLFAGKVTWQPTPATTLLFTVHGDPATHRRVGPAIEINGTPDSLLNIDPVLGRLRQGSITISGSATHRTGRLTLRSALQRTGWRNRNVAATPIGRTEAQFIDPATRTWSGGYGISIDEHIARILGSLSASLDRERHALKAGIELEDNNLREFFAYGYPANTGGYRMVGENGPFFVIDGGINGRVRTRNLTVYAQDGWTPTRRLKVNYGLRWDGQFFIDSPGRIAQSITDGWQPRLGLVLDPTGMGKSRFFASAGRFYQQIATALAANQFAGLYQSFTAPHDAGVDTVLFINGKTVPGVDGLKGEHFDEIAGGYERITSSGVKLGVRGIRREIREVVEDAYASADSLVIGNPGKGRLEFLNAPRRDYSALELILERIGRGSFEYGASYVLSRNYGNYPGVFDSDNGVDLAANFTPQFDDSAQARNGSGLLPNDRTHAFKFFGAWQPRVNLSGGATVTWQSGTPISELATNTSLGYGHLFLSDRGSAGRTASVFDLSLRLTWEPLPGSRTSPRIIADFFHVGSKRSVLAVDQFKERDGSPNPAYKSPILYQSPFTMRFGVTLNN